MQETIIRIIHFNEVIHEALSSRNVDWENPIEFIPQVGSEIEYTTLTGSVKRYDVQKVRHLLKESVNDSSFDKVIETHVTVKDSI